jgi:hypothetical protein
MNTGSIQIPMQDLTNNRRTEFSRLEADLNILGTPQNLRKTLARIDTLEESHATTVTSGYATIFAAIAASTALAPSIVTAAETCKPTSPDTDWFSCGANVAASLGALIGIIGVGYSIKALKMGDVHVDRQIAGMDSELQLRHGPTIARYKSNPNIPAHQKTNRSAENIASRYRKLNKSDRLVIQAALQRAYVEENTGVIPNLPLPTANEPI